MKMNDFEHQNIIFKKSCRITKSSSSNFFYPVSLDFSVVNFCSNLSTKLFTQTLQIMFSTVFQRNFSTQFSTQISTNFFSSNFSQICFTQFSTNFGHHSYFYLILWRFSSAQFVNLMCPTTKIQQIYVTQIVHLIVLPNLPSLFVCPFHTKLPDYFLPPIFST